MSIITAIAATIAAYVVFDIILAACTRRLVGVPGLGSTPAVAMYGCDYLAWAAAVTRGDFSISLMFEAYTFLNTPNTVRYFCSASRHELALQPAVQHFTKKNFGLSSELWSEGEAKPAHILRKLLAPNQLAERNVHLCRALLKLRHQYFPVGQVDLAKAIPEWVMHATAEALFGSQFLNEVMPAPLLLEHLITFDAEFEAAASPLPGFLFPNFKKAKAALLKAFCQAIENDVLQGTIAEAVYRSSGVPAEQHAGALLALLWAGLTNVSASTFWAVAFLMLPENARWRHAVQEQMAPARAAATAGRPLHDTADAVLEAALSQGEDSVVHGCVSEALRLRAQGIVLRRSVQRLRIPQPDGHEHDRGRSTPSLCIPAGRLVAISPFQIHHDPRFFGDPELFDPSRHCRKTPHASGRDSGPPVQADCVQAGNAAYKRVDGESANASAAVGRTGGTARMRVAFGAGPFRCPGRALAMAEAALAVGIFFSCFNSRLSALPVPEHASLAEGCTQCGNAEAYDTQAPGRRTGVHGPAAGAAAPAAGTGRGSNDAPKANAQGGPADSELQPHKKVPGWLTQDVVPGTHVVARGVRSGDSCGLLPSFEPRLLVGVKKPVGALWATCTEVAD